MARRTYYPLARPLLQFAALLDIDADRIVRRAGLPRDFIQNGGNGGTPAQFAAVWSAVEAECDRSDLAVTLAKAFAHGPFLPPMFAFSCSPDIETGLKRLAIFKPLIGPVRLDVSKDPTGLLVEIGSTDIDSTIPGFWGVFEALFILESARVYSAAHIVPVELGLPSPQDMRSDDRDFAGVGPIAAPVPYLRFSLEDATRPLITENSEAWPDFERRMRANLAEQDRETPMTLRVKITLLDMLPAGEASIEALCGRLGMSKRSVQRRLKGEGERFQTILAATRSELAMKYLTRDELSVEEISYLLAYREPTSFYRAFHDWTGMTPMEARGAQYQ